MRKMKPTAYKLRIRDLVRGRFVRPADISEPSHLVTPSGLKVVRARVIGTVVEKFVREDGGYAMVRLDDGTETVTVRAWREGVRELERFEAGDVLDVLGRVREFGGEIYIVPELMLEVKDPNVEVMREAENLRFAWEAGALGPSGVPGGAEPQASGELSQEVPEELKNKVVLALDKLDSSDGASPSEISMELGLPLAQVEEALRSLLITGSIYEPTAGRYRLAR